MPSPHLQLGSYALEARRALEPMRRRRLHRRRAAQDELEGVVAGGDDASTDNVDGGVQPLPKLVHLGSV